MFHLVKSIPQNETVVFAGNMHGNIESSNVGYDGTHRGFGYGSKNADGSRILEFAQTCEEYKRMDRDKVEDAEWKGLDVNEHWQQMKYIMMKTAKDIRGMSKGPNRHKAS